MRSMGASAPPPGPRGGLSWATTVGAAGRTETLARPIFARLHSHADTREKEWHYDSMSLLLDQMIVGGGRGGAYMRAGRKRGSRRGFTCD